MHSLGLELLSGLIAYLLSAGEPGLEPSRKWKISYQKVQGDPKQLWHKILCQILGGELLLLGHSLSSRALLSAELGFGYGTE